MPVRQNARTTKCSNDKMSRQKNVKKDKHENPDKPENAFGFKFVPSSISLY